MAKFLGLIKSMSIATRSGDTSHRSRDICVSMLWCLYQYCPGYCSKLCRILRRLCDCSFAPVMGNWIGLNLLAVNLTWVESTSSAGRVEFELDWNQVNLNPIFTRKKIQSPLNFTITIHRFFSQGGAHVNSQQDIMKEAIAGLFCISMSIV